MKKYTLRLRLTAIVGVILLAACALLTTNSLFAAHTYYGDYAALLDSGLADIDPALSGEVEIDPVIKEPENYFHAASQKFSAQSLAAMALIVALALAGTYWATGRVLRPLKKLTQSVRAVDDRHLDRRVAVEQARGEVLALTESFNHMLDRLEDAFLIQKSFASNAAHELKTPLAVMKSSLQVLEMDPHPETADYREFMQDTAQSLDRIIKTVDGLLALADIGAVPAEETVPLRPLLEQALRELAARAAEHGVRLSLDNEQQAAVTGNASLLYRAFFNLIENAIKYNRPGGSVTLSSEPAGDTVRVRVADTGIGMTPEELRHIFEPFYRADQSRSQRIPGSGLGLPVVQMILQRHGGGIAATSEPGSGSAFVATLRMAQGAQTE
ncbi:HAMP domain-containing histidine kinase [Butyricicoccus faecihominis]|uniref:sensor histidine kinase n=1 Tax=Butyricicoccus faecihominis TaxID=1712515 RepID=UPI002479CEF0|nr:HAMP domain-containing histidine kinase [Butyricicoccus faecihominis]